jgi:hypothetical protein
MTNLAVVLGLNITDKICGTSSESARVIAESQKMNRETREMVLNVSQSTNEIFEQIALSGRLLAESIKNDNIRRFREIETERRKILNS